MVMKFLLNVIGVSEESSNRNVPPAPTRSLPPSPIAIPFVVTAVTVLEIATVAAAPAPGFDTESVPASETGDVTRAA